MAEKQFKGNPTVPYCREQSSYPLILGAVWGKKLGKKKVFEYVYEFV